MKRWSLAGLGWALLVTGLVGCGGDEPPPEPPSSATGSPSPTPTDSPSASDTAGPETAEDFIRRWVEANTEMQNTGETAEFRKLGRGCSPCKSVADTVDSFYSAGGYVKTEGWNIESVEPGHESSGDGSQLILHIESRPTEYKESADGDVMRLPGEITRYRFDLGSRNDHWVVTDFVEVPS